MAQAKRKQKFFDVEMPILGKKTQLYAFEKKDLEGRTITYDLTRLLRGKSMIIKLIVKLEGDKITSIPKKIIIMPYFIRRMMRKGIDYVEDSFLSECKDASVRIKPFLITRKKVSKSIRKALRNETKKELVGYIKNKNSESLFDEIIKNKLQKTLSQKLKKIYPLSLCEIRVFEVVKEIQNKE
ncbi:MAG: hypothetical protein QXX55_00765 [Candidatus Pacearchaeota archaeon]